MTWHGWELHGKQRHSAARPGPAQRHLSRHSPQSVPPRAGAQPAPARVPWHSQYLMTAMFTGAVQVAMASPRSAAIAAATAGRPQAPPPRHECDRGQRRVPPRHWSRAQQPVPNSQ